MIRGPGGTIWGPNAVNGVINIITKSSKDTQGTFASTGGGNEEQAFGNFRYGGGTGGGLTYRVYAKAFTRSPEYHFNGGDNFDDWRGGQTGFRTDWARGDDSFTVQGDVYRQENGQRVSLGNYNPPFQKDVSANAALSGGNLLARWSRKVDDANSFQIQTFYDRTNRFEPNLGERRDTFDIDFVQRKNIKARQQLTFGLGVRFSDGRFAQVISGLVFDPRSRLDYLLSGFFQDDITISPDKLVVSLGVKLLRTNFLSFTAQPSGRILWTPNKTHTFWAAFTHAIRAPSRVEHDFYLSSFLGTAPNGLLQFARFNANPDFAPEQLNGYEVGYRTLPAKNFFIDIAGFWNHYHDLFSQNLLSFGFEDSLPFPDPSPPPPHAIITAQFQNNLYGFTTGGEIAPEWRPTETWRLRGAYSYLNMNLSTAPRLALGGTPASVIGSSPRHKANLQSSFDLPKRLQLDLVFRYASALPAVSAPAYATGDARIAWRFKKNMEFSVSGRNLFQPHHVEYTDNPGGPVGIRRSVFATIALVQ